MTKEISDDDIFIVDRSNSAQIDNLVNALGEAAPKYTDPSGWATMIRAFIDGFPSDEARFTVKDVNALRDWMHERSVDNSLWEMVSGGELVVSVQDGELLFAMRSKS